MMINDGKHPTVDIKPISSDLHKSGAYEFCLINLINYLRDDDVVSLSFPSERQE